MTVIYKICTAKEWHEAEHAGAYTGSAHVPAQFGAANDVGCGVVMVWSKTGADRP